MNVYFIGADDSEQIISTVSDTLLPDQASKKVMLAIEGFCWEHKFEIPYIRYWSEDRNGKSGTIFDVGSHAEFFFVDRPMM